MAFEPLWGAGEFGARGVINQRVVLVFELTESAVVRVAFGADLIDRSDLCLQCRVLVFDRVLLLAGRVERGTQPLSLGLVGTLTDFGAENVRSNAATRESLSASRNLRRGSRASSPASSAVNWAPRTRPSRPSARAPAPAQSPGASPRPE